MPARAELPNGFYVNYSASVAVLPDGYQIENGILLDVMVDVLDEDVLSGKETIIEIALAQFN